MAQSPLIGTEEALTVVAVRRAHVAALIAHGSWIVGLPHRSSDLDLACIVRDDLDVPRPTVHRRATVPTVVHIEYFHIAQLEPDRFEEALVGCMLDSNIASGRIGQGTVLYEVEDAGSGLLARYATWEPPKRLLVKLVGECASLRDDATGSYEVAPDRAEVALRFAAHCMAKLSLVLNGCYYLAPKMQLELLERHSPADAECLRRVLGLAGGSLADRLAQASAWYARLIEGVRVTLRHRSTEPAHV